MGIEKWGGEYHIIKKPQLVITRSDCVCVCARAAVLLRAKRGGR